MKGEKKRFITGAMILVISIFILSCVLGDWNDSNLLHEWKFESNGDDEKNTHNLTISGATYVDSTISGSTKALNLTGSGFAYNVSVIGISGFPFTFSAWVNTTDTTSGHNMVMCLSYADLDNLYYGGGVESGNISSVFANFEDGTVEITCNNTVADGDWHLLTWIFAANNNIRLYVDGSSACNLTTGSGSFNGAINEFNIGRKEGENPSLYFSGSIDNARHWNKSLTQAEISSLYNDEKPTGITSLLITNVANGTTNNESTTITWTTNIDSDTRIDYWKAGSGNLYQYLDLGFHFTGNYNDFSDNNKSTSIVNSPTLTTDKNDVANQSYDFDGDSVVIGDYQLSTPQTISFWFRTTVDANRYLWNSGADGSAQKGFFIYQKSDGDIDIWIGNGVGSPYMGNFVFGLNTNIWYHVLITWTGDTSANGLKMYKNGELVSSATSTKNWTGVSHYNISIGANILGGGPGITGKLDEVYFFDKVLNSSEISNLYNKYDTAIIEPIKNTTYTQTHSIPVTGLDSSTLYYYNVTSSNVTYSNTSAIYNFTTTATPTINFSSIVATVGNDSVNLTWSTNIVSNSTVNYGITTGLGSYTYNSTSSTTHAVKLTGLTNNTLYYYNLTSEIVGVSNTTGVFNFTTAKTPRINFSSISVSVTNQTAVVTWTTNLASNSTVNSGTTESLGTYTYNSTSSTSHSVTITGLNDSTLYYYNITSAKSDDTNTTGVFNFTTDSNPTINFSSIVATPTNESVVITWTTNLASNSTVNSGLTTGLGTYTYNTTDSTSHSVTVTGLSASTLYYYNISSAHVDDTNTTGVFNFTTTATSTTYNSDYLGRADGSSALFIDKNNAGCNDSHTRAQALVGTTPWCGLKGNQYKVQSGDSVYIRAGNYNLNGSNIDFNNTFANYVTIQPYNTNETVIHSNYYPAYLDTPNTLWGVYNSTSKVYYTNVTVNETEHCHVAFEDNRTYFPSYDSLDHINLKYTDEDYPPGVYCDATANRIYIRMTGSMDPNNVGFYVASGEWETFKVTGNKWAFYNFTFLHSTTPFNINNGDLTIVDNNNFTGCTKRCVWLESGADVVTISNNYFNSHYPDGFPWSTVKNDAAASENGAIWASGIGEKNTFTGNTIRGFFNGIFSETSDDTQNENLTITYNNITRIFDDGIEIESYHRGLNISYNNVTEAFTPLSIAPANSDPDFMSYVEYNLLAADMQILSYYTGAVPTYWNGRVLKIDRWGGPTWSVNNMIINQNTFVTQNGALIVGTTASGEIEDNLINVTFTNNLFFHNSTDKIMYGSGEYANNVTYDYNHYYQLLGDFAQYYNSNSNTTTFSNFTEAYDSSSRPANWESNSTYGVVNFTDTVNYIPVVNESVCNASSTGSFIGAFDCVNPVANNVTIINSYTPTDDEKVNSKLLSINATDLDNDTLTYYFYNGSSTLLYNGSDSNYTWSALTDGVHEWTGKVNDGTQTVSTGLVNFSYDGTDPTGTVVASNDTPLLNYTVNITDTNIYQCYQRISNSSYNVIDCVGSFNITMSNGVVYSGGIYGNDTHGNLALIYTQHPITYDSSEGGSGGDTPTDDDDDVEEEPETPVEDTNVTGGGGGGSPPISAIERLAAQTSIESSESIIFGDLIIDPAMLLLKRQRNSQYLNDIKITNTGLIDKNISLELLVENDYVTVELVTPQGLTTTIDNLVIPKAIGLQTNFIYLRYKVTVAEDAPLGMLDPVIFKVVDKDTGIETELTFQINVKTGVFDDLEFMNKIMPLLQYPAFKWEFCSYDNINSEECIPMAFTLKIWHIVLALFILSVLFILIALFK